MKKVLCVIALTLADQLLGGVRYRGVFINDEDWCLRPWCESRFGKERGICAEAYEEIFADMKSRGSNLLWPAMHPGGYQLVARCWENGVRDIWMLGCFPERSCASRFRSTEESRSWWRSLVRTEAKTSTDARDAMLFSTDTFVWRRRAFSRKALIPSRSARLTLA